jgi:hypothetical protein
MTNRAKWTRRRCLRAGLVCIACLLIIWGLRSGWVSVDSAKAVLLKHVTMVNPKKSNSCRRLGNHCLDSPNCDDVAAAYAKLADIDPNSAEAFAHLGICSRSRENSKKP